LTSLLARSPSRRSSWSIFFDLSAASFSKVLTAQPIVTEDTTKAAKSYATVGNRLRATFEKAGREKGGKDTVRSALPMIKAGLNKDVMDTKAGQVFVPMLAPLFPFLFFSSSPEVSSSSFGGRRELNGQNGGLPRRLPPGGRRARPRLAGRRQGERQQRVRGCAAGANGFRNCCKNMHQVERETGNHIGPIITMHVSSNDFKTIKLMLKNAKI